MKHGGRNNDVVRRCGEGNFADVALHRTDSPVSNLFDSLNGSIEHRPAEVDERHIELGEFPQELQRVITGTAADIEQRAGLGIGGRRGPGNQFQNERRVNRCGLARFQIAETLDLTIEALLDLFRRGFHAPLLQPVYSRLSDRIEMSEFAVHLRRVLR